MKKVVAIYGSHRKSGNSAHLTDVLLDAIPEDVEIKKFYLADMDIAHCKGCFVCRRNGNVCVHKDDFLPLLNAIAEADRVVISIPVFFGTACSSVTAFIHRGYILLEGENGQYTLRIPKKDTVAIYSQGSPFPDEFRKGIDLTNFALGAMGLKIKETIVCTLSNEIGAAAQRRELLEKAEQAGRTLFEQKMNPRM